MQIINEIDYLSRVGSALELCDQDLHRGRYTALKGTLTPTYCAVGQAISPGGGQRLLEVENDNIRRGDVHIFKDSNVYFLPKYGILIDTNQNIMRFTFSEAAYYFKSNIENIPFVERVQDELFFNPPKFVKNIDKAIICCPWGGTRNYGHWLLDCMPAVAALNHTAAFKSYKFVFPVLKPWQSDHLRLLGVEDHIELNDEVYLVKEAIWSSCMDHFLHNPNSNLALMREAQLMNISEPLTSGRKICISRKSDNKRQFAGADALEASLERIGFELLEPASLAVSDQIQIFRQAKIVTGFSGAGFANVIYCRPDAAVCEIMSPLMSGIWVRNACAIVGCKWTYFNINDLEGDGLKICQAELLNFISGL